MLLEMLPKTDADALRRTKLEGLTQAEAANRAGVSLPAMKSRVQRARAKLRETLLACCEIELDARQQPIDYRCRHPQVCGCSDTGIEHCTPPEASVLLKIEQSTSRAANRPVSQKPSVTAGFR